MKITKQRIREIVKETLSKRLEEQEPAEQGAAEQGPEVRQDIGTLVNKIIDDGGDDTVIAQLQKIFKGLNPAKQAIVIDVLIKRVTGKDLGDKYIKQGVMNPDN
jgi:hypothetical protein